MTRRIPARLRSPAAECHSGSRSLGAMWMHELTKSLTDVERDALAKALALLLERSNLAVGGPEGLAR